jgi:D-alanine-D-alanine ligase
MQNEFDLVFNFSEGIRGDNREAYFPTILEMLGISFTGSDSLTMAIGFNKVKTKEILAFNGIPTPNFQQIKEENEKIKLHLKFPLIVKPVHEGSSIGINKTNIVYDEHEAKKKISELLIKYEQPVLVEEFIDGREFTVGVLGNEKIKVLPIVEVKNKSSQNSYKWVWDKSLKSENYFECPAGISKVLENKIKHYAEKTFRVLNFKDWVRIDFRIDKQENPYVFEVNAVAGLSDHSALPVAARAAGMSFNQLINEIILNALERYRKKTIGSRSK